MAACVIHDSFVGHSDQVSILNESINFNWPSSFHPLPHPPCRYSREGITVRYLFLGALITRFSEPLQISQYADYDGVMKCACEVEYLAISAIIPTRGAQIFQKRRSHLKILGAKGVT